MRQEDDSFPSVTYFKGYLWNLQNLLMSKIPWKSTDLLKDIFLPYWSSQVLVESQHEYVFKLYFKFSKLLSLQRQCSKFLATETPYLKLFFHPVPGDLPKLTPIYYLISLHSVSLVNCHLLVKWHSHAWAVNHLHTSLHYKIYSTTI